MTKPVCLGLSVLDIRKTIMYEFWYNYIKPKYGEKAKLCYIDTDSYFIYIETEGFYKGIINDVERLFYTSNYGENDERPLPIGKNKKLIGLFKGESIGKGKTMKENCTLRAKAYAHLMEDDNEHKKAR